MPTIQEQFDDAVYAFTTGDSDTAIAGFKAILAQEPGNFDAQLALGNAYFTKGDYAAAIAEGHKAEQMKPKDQMVHTNLSRAYMKAGDKKTAEHHGLQSRIAGWRSDMAAPAPKKEGEADLEMAKPPLPPSPVKPPDKFPDMPWKKKAPTDH